MLYLGWYDDSKTPVVDKIADGAAAYHKRFHVFATVCLCNEADRGQMTRVDTMRVTSDGTVQKNCFWIGQDE